MKYEKPMVQDLNSPARTAAGSDPLSCIPGGGDVLFCVPGTVAGSDVCAPGGADTSGECGSGANPGLGNSCLSGGTADTGMVCTAGGGGIVGDNCGAGPSVL